jgi:archaellum component FlaC
MSTVLTVEGVSKTEEPTAEVTRIRLKDTVYPLYVTVCYRAYNDVDMIETWTEIENLEKKPVTLTRFDSGYLPVRVGDVWLSHLHGTWAAEGRLVQEPLDRGMRVIKNKDGSRNSHTDHAEVMFSLDGKPQENSGRVIGAALCYSGNYELRIDTKDTDYHEFFAGINPDNSESNGVNLEFIKNDIENLSNTLNIISEKISEIDINKKSIDNINAKLNNQSKNFNSVEKDIKALQSEGNYIINEISNLKNKLDDTSSKNESVINDINDLKEDISSLSKLKGDITSISNNVSNVNSSLTKRINDTENDIIKIVSLHILAFSIDWSNFVANVTAVR